jgi:solute carrier family 25 S-adenosylmethionine transporter 26
LQSAAGFARSGGFAGVYRGVGSALVGSAPGAALFFVTYDTCKARLRDAFPATSNGSDGSSGASATTAATATAVQHMLAASVGEVAACAVRVPTEVIKQRAQASQHASSLAALRAILGSGRQLQEQRNQHSISSSSGGGSGGGKGARGGGLVGFFGGVAGARHVWRELYRGWGVTVLREVPFTMLQFPLWEALKRWRQQQRRQQQRRQQKRWRQQQQHRTHIGAGTGSSTGTDTRTGLGTGAAGAGGTLVAALDDVDDDVDERVPALESAACGALAGAVAAAATTPLDVLKTRLMLAPHRARALSLLRAIVRQEGARALFAGAVPRVLWIAAGGAIFLGSYEWTYNAFG